MNKVIKTCIPLICFLFLVIDAQRQALESPVLPRLTEKIKSIIGDVHELGSTLSDKTALNKLHSSQMKVINSLVTNATLEINNAMTIAKSDGKNASHCRSSGREQVNNASATASIDIMECLSRAEKPVIMWINSALETGEKLLAQFDNIAAHCTNNKSQMMKVYCIAMKMPDAIRSAKEYESEIRKLKIMINHYRESAKISIPRCLNDARWTLEQALTSARVLTELCIDFS